MERPESFRKYIILEQLDSGFGIQRAPGGFVRLEGNQEGIGISVQIKFIKEGTQPYTVVLIYDKDEELGVFRVGTLQVVSGIASYRKFLDHDTITSLDIKPNKIKYILIVSEHQDRFFIPLVGMCKKEVPWDEVVRQRLMRKDKEVQKHIENKPAQGSKTVQKSKPTKEIEWVQENKSAQEKNEVFEENVRPLPQEEHARESQYINEYELEDNLKQSFEKMDPFSNPRHDYYWYRVNDIAKLSNLLYSSGVKVPLFANPKILVGLFKYRHLLAGFYRSDINDLNYFVLGVPAKDETDGKPFENICLWVPTQNTEFGDMAGYWLVYINLKNGEFVR
ncbi:MAG TPA: hypothetical protein VFD00_00420 [Thermoclostridium sp.]|nr:hypothetical protein [Thermoclostridium sp.]